MSRSWSPGERIRASGDERSDADGHFGAADQQPRDVEPVRSFERHERTELVSLHHGNGDAVTTRHPVAAGGTHSVSGSDDAGEVERVGGRNDGEGTRSRRASNLAQRLNRLGQRELFPGHPGHEAAAANLAASLQSPIDARQLAPRRGVRLARQQPSKNDAVPFQQRPGLMFDRVVARARASSCRTAAQRPAKLARRSCLNSPPCAVATRSREAGESVGDRKSGSDQNAHRLPEPVVIERHAGRDFVEERRAAAPQPRQAPHARRP